MDAMLPYDDLAPTRQLLQSDSRASGSSVGGANGQCRDSLYCCKPELVQAAIGLRKFPAREIGLRRTDSIDYAWGNETGTEGFMS